LSNIVLFFVVFFLLFCYAIPVWGLQNNKKIKKKTANFLMEPFIVGNGVPIGRGVPIRKEVVVPVKTEEIMATPEPLPFVVLDKRTSAAKIAMIVLFTLLMLAIVACIIALFVIKQNKPRS
jgi:hypothetical protein